MLKCVLLSLAFLLGVTTPLPTDSSVDLGTTESESYTTIEQGDVTPEETTRSQLAEDDEEIEDILDNDVELSTSSAETIEEHIFVFDDDSEENDISNDIKEPEDKPIVEETEDETAFEEIEDETVFERKLENPDPQKCAQRPNHFSHRGHNYWFSGDEAAYANTKADWLEARNICRKHCMDLVSIETPAEHNLIATFLTERDLPYTWTSGRLCNFKGCEEREDLQPINVAGWFWSGSGVRIAPTNSTPPFWMFQPWSHTGHKSQFFSQDIPQPDNAEEEINGSTEACLAVFNDVYDDGVAWHDVACYHKKMFICEDEEDLVALALGQKP